MGIEEHEWSDEIAEIIDTDNGDIHLLKPYWNSNPPYITKQDAIAIAKHFKLNAKDLEQS